MGKRGGIDGSERGEEEENIREKGEHSLRVDGEGNNELRIFCEIATATGDF